MGQTLDCADDGPSEWTNAPRSYGYLWADATTSVVLATGQQYTPTAADAGRSIECAGIATNAGATTEGYPSEPHTVGAAVPVSSSTTAVAPPPAADTTPPLADDGQADVRHSRSLLTRLSRRRQGRRFLVTLHVGAALVGHRASVAWETDKRKHGPSVHETRQTVTLQASTVLRSPVVPRGRFLELILTPPGVTVAGVAYDDVDLRVQVGRR